MSLWALRACASWRRRRFSSSRSRLRRCWRDSGGMALAGIGERFRVGCLAFLGQGLFGVAGGSLQGVGAAAQSEHLVDRQRLIVGPGQGIQRAEAEGQREGGEAQFAVGARIVFRQRLQRRVARPFRVVFAGWQEDFGHEGHDPVEDGLGDVVQFYGCVTVICVCYGCIAGFGPEQEHLWRGDRPFDPCAAAQDGLIKPDRVHTSWKRFKTAKVSKISVMALPRSRRGRAMTWRGRQTACKLLR